MLKLFDEFNSNPTIKVNDNTIGAAFAGPVADKSLQCKRAKCIYFILSCFYRFDQCCWCLCSFHDAADVKSPCDVNNPSIKKSIPTHAALCDDAHEPTHVLNFGMVNFFCFLHLVFILITREEHKQILFLWKFSYPFFVFMSRSSFTTPGIIKKQNFEMSSVSPGEGQMQLFLWSCLLVLMETLFFKYFCYIVFIVTIFCRLPCHKEA